MSSVINYDRPVLNLIDGLNATGHVTHQSFRKTSVTVHHNGGRLSHQGVLNVWKVRPASAHFNVDAKGTLAQYVAVAEFAWATGNRLGNQSTINIEMCNSAVGGNWPVSETTWKSAARLAGWLFARVIGAKPSKNNLFYHHHWLNTQCAGPFMDSIYNQFLAETVKAYDYFRGATTPPKPGGGDNRGDHKSLTQLAAEVWAGKWGSGEDRLKRLRAAGYDANKVQELVNRGIGRTTASAPTSNKKPITVIAQEVIDNKWGNGDDRRARLASAGYNPTTVQNEVNRLLGASKRTSITKLAQEVIAGKWGNGADRQRRLTQAGYSYQQVQVEVNRIS